MTNTTEATIKELEEENELLLLQLHQVQEELERYYLRNQELEQGKGGQAWAQPSAQAPTGWVHEELPNILAEQLRIKAQLDAQQELHRLQTENALNARIGNLLIEAVDQGSILSIPSKLIKVWRQSSQTTPPAALGGKDFEQIIAAWQKDGFTAVEQLLAQVPTSQAIKANAYTALARHLRGQDRKRAAEAAHRAYAVDPKTHRLKWLAFRLHEAGNSVEADAMLSLLPPDTQFSDSEARQVDEVRYQANHARLHEARTRTAYVERRQEAERKLKALTKARDEQTRLAQQKDKELAALKDAGAKLEKEKAALVRERDGLQAQQKSKAAEYAKSLEQEKATQASVRQSLEKQLHEKENAAKAQLAKLDQQVKEGNEENQLLLLQLHQDQEELERIVLKHQEAEKSLGESAKEIEALKAAQSKLAEEKAALAGQHQEAERLAAERGQAIEALNAAQSKLAEEKAALAGRHQEAERLAADRGQAIEALNAAQSQLEAEKAALAGRHQEAERLAAERLKQINELQQQIQSRQASEAELAARQQLINEEMVRAEAQLDLIKDMLLREPGL